MDINSVGIRGNWVYFEPQYPDADMRDYYVFGGWYFDEDHTEKIPVIENDPAYADVPAHQKHFYSDFKMPADDVTLYAKWDLVKEDVSFYRDYKAFITGAAPINQCRVDYNDRILTADVPTTVLWSPRRTRPSRDGITSTRPTHPCVLTPNPCP